MFENLELGDTLVLKDTRSKLPLSLVTVIKLTTRTITVNAYHSIYNRKTGSLYKTANSSLSLLPFDETTKEAIKRQEEEKAKLKRCYAVARHVHYNMDLFSRSYEELSAVADLLKIDISEF